MNSIQFQTKLINIHQKYIIHLPKDISALLHSRGMIMANVTIDQISLPVALEPDGNFSHWFELTTPFIDPSSVFLEKTLSISIVVLDEWMSPEIPEDLALALAQSNLQLEWSKITAKAQWEWIRWIRFTKHKETREKRIHTTCSMLSNGKKRPCCFDQSRCTEPSLMNSKGQLDL